MATLNFLHFNDVYRVQPFKLQPKSPETIDVTQWTSMLDEIRDQWPLRPDGKRDGLVLFSGDVFSPSVESSVTRGSHMVPVMNAIGPDISLTGNHDFDFGYPHLSKLIQDTNYPWILSNIIDSETSRVPEHLLEFYVFERSDVRIGVIGLVEKEWIATVSTWPSNFKYKDMAEVAIDLSRRLRDPEGEHKCDFIIALTHARVPNDIKLAKSINALSPSAQESQSIENIHGADIIFGGHDHLYYVSRGVTSWEGYDLDQEVLGGEEDHGDVLVVKSGTDFRDLSEIALELADTPEGSIRRKVIKTIRGKHHETKPGSKKSERVAKLLEDLLSSVSSALKAPVCKTDVELDVRSSIIRVQETVAANWFADVLRHAYDDALCLQTGGGSDGVFICAGTLRGDSIYGPGVVTLGDILEILPFEDPIVVLELDGEAIWAALEASLETWPAQEGRFPVISGFRVSWDSRRPAGQRVLGVWLLQEPSGGSTNTTPSHSGTASPIMSQSNSAASSKTSLLQSATSAMAQSSATLVDGDPIPRVKGGRKYSIVTREYMAQGHDGFLPLKGAKYLVDDESGQLMSAIVRKYLLGCRFVNRLSRMASMHHVNLLDPETTNLVSREKARQAHTSATHRSRSKSRDRLSAIRSLSPVKKDKGNTTPRAASPVQRAKSPAGRIGDMWRRVAGIALRWSRGHYRDHLRVTGREHMSDVDCFDGDRMRKGEFGGDQTKQQEKGQGAEELSGAEEDLVTIHPVVDGRLKDEGRK
ncbi:Metallo-dependent phosphatase [Trametes versicolor FP-101664 SS1]|uniref:Metallo-dependent phosphatase n=1 Tax=Trametes versicolor (strain FP-101664) TaxID=717944 RepID=UPI00046249B9|nr:Metallo-dependent phosphatase [Trametes versicolor FP-101664 SS1]EIW60617.1 Metallo-dependent phosphatase [Trametes versicolor FP-101664 SS1]